MIKNILLLSATALSLTIAQNTIAGPSGDTYAGCLFASPYYNQSTGVSGNYWCKDIKCSMNKAGNILCTNKYNKYNLT